MSDYLKLLYHRALSAGDPALLQVSFDAAVLDRYRERPEFSVIRTNTAGRVRKQGGWSVDFGIAEGDAIVHVSWQYVEHSLPEDERDHWASHAAGVVSENYVRMQMAPGSCFDDGDVRTW
ncbi:MAG: hypothetical protein WEC75_00965 [Dehalococcoidia bacterium]